MQFWYLIKIDYFLTINVLLKHLIKYFIQVFHKSNEGKKGLVTSYEVTSSATLN